MIWPSSELALCRLVASANDEFQGRKGQYETPGACATASADLLGWAEHQYGTAAASMYLIAWDDNTQQPAKAPVLYKHPDRCMLQPSMVEICIDAIYTRKGDSCVWAGKDTACNGTRIVAYRHAVVHAVGESVFLDWSIDQLHAPDDMSLRLCSSVGEARDLPGRHQHVERRELVNLMYDATCARQSWHVKRAHLCPCTYARKESC
jgi:hypothetical protein